MIETQKSKKLDYKGLNKEETKILKRMRKKKHAKLWIVFPILRFLYRKRHVVLLIFFYMLIVLGVQLA
jgi:hypothetical protein